MSERLKVAAVALVENEQDKAVATVLLRDDYARTVGVVIGVRKMVHEIDKLLELIRRGGDQEEHEDGS
jgi:hypothetical protein